MIHRPAGQGAAEVPVSLRTESHDKNMKHGNVDTLVNETCKETTEPHPSYNSNFLKRSSQNA